MTEAIENRLRNFLLLLATFTLSATTVELWLEDHTQDALQWIPFVLCGVGLVALMSALLRPQKSTLLALRVVMVLLALGGLLGTTLHLLNNIAFEQEIRPAAGPGEVLMSAIKGANPLWPLESSSSPRLLLLPQLTITPHLETAGLRKV